MKRTLNAALGCAMGLLLGAAALAGTASADTYDYRMQPSVINTAVSGGDWDFSEAFRNELEIPRGFRITRPEQQLTTTYQRYFITGTSDPSRPVYYENEEISRLGAMGTFGVLVDLELGANTFTFRQGDRRETVTIVRKSPPDGAAAISEITQSSMFPSVHGGGKSGEAMPVSCVAPAGASVTATFDGKSVRLSQVAAANAGIPATFQGQLTIGGDYDPATIQEAGPVTYTMTYHGVTKSYQSSGDVYVAGRNTYIGVRVSAVLGIIYPDTSRLGDIKECVKPGGVEFVRIDTQRNGYFQLYSGGWIPVGHVEMITGELKISNRLESAALRTGAKSETITFSGTNKPFFDAVQGENTFTFRMYNSSGTPNLNVSDSRLFSGVSVNNENKRTTYTFTFKNRADYWGYDVSYDEDGNTMLRLNYKPKLQGGSQPLRGVRILLDPGHGGTDPGALGLAGTTGPMEDTLNLAHAIVVQHKLAELGADVFLTRNDDFNSSLDQRLIDNADTAPDFFLSLHHNSIAESSDANTAAGVETYYINSNSKELSDTMLEAFSTTGRRQRSSSPYAFRVTLLPRCPAILMELGFMSHPLEYENATLRSQMELVAESVANGVINTLR